MVSNSAWCEHMGGNNCERNKRIVCNKMLSKASFNFNKFIKENTQEQQQSDFECPSIEFLMIRLSPQMQVTTYETIDDLSTKETSDDVFNFIASKVSDNLHDMKDEFYPQIPFIVYWFVNSNCIYSRLNNWITRHHNWKSFKR